MRKTDPIKYAPSRTILLVLLVFSGLLLTLFAFVLFTFVQTRHIQLSHDAYLNLALQELELIDELQDNDNSIHNAMLLHLTASEESDKVAYEKEINSTQAHNQALIIQLKSMISDGYRKKLVLDFEQELLAHDSLINRLLQLSRAGELAKAIAYNNSIITPEYRQQQQYLRELSTSIRQDTRHSGHNAATAIAAYVRNHEILLGILALACLATFFLVRHILQRMRHDNNRLLAEMEQRQHLQRALQESQTQYKLLFDSNPMPMWVYDQHSSQFTDVNEAALQEYGYTRHEFLQLGISAILPQPDVPPHKIKTAQHNDLQASRMRHMRKDGRTFEVEVISHTLPPAGQMLPRLVIAINVHERLQMIDQLQKSEQQLREISSSIPGAVFRLEMRNTKDFTFTFLSEGVHNLFHISPEEVYADTNTLYRHLYSEDVATVRQAIIRSYLLRAPFQVVFRIEQPQQGQYKWVQAHGLPTWKGQGHMIWNGTMIDITDQKTAQENLIRSEANLLALLNSSPQAIYLLDEHMHVVHCNKVARTEVRKQLLRELKAGTCFLDLVHPDKATDLIEQHQHAMRGQTIIYEAGRSAYWHEIALRPVLDPENNVLAVSLSVLDISERKMALETIRRNEEQLARAQQLALLGNWEFDLEHDLFTWSDSVYEIYGVNSHHFIPSRNNVLLAIPANEREKVKLTYEEAIANQQIVSVQHRIIRPNGEERVIYEIGEPIYDDQGNFTRFHGTVQDITARIEAEQETLKAKKMLQSTLENIPEMIFSADTSLNTLYVSPQCLELTGYTEAEMTQQPQLMYTIIHPEDSAFADEHILPYVLKGEKQHYELRIKTKEGRYKWLMMRISPRIDNHGQVYRIDGSASDMTSYREAQQKRDELTDQLLRQNQNLQQFAYIVSHNLRAPIANILGLTTIYDTQKPDSAMNRQVIQNLFRSAKLLDTTIRDLNDLLTIRSELSNVREKVYFKEVYDDIMDSLPDEMAGNDVVFKTNFDGGLFVIAVRSYVHSIMQNLITNALKYRSPDRNLQIRINTFTIPHYLCLSIADNGLGIDLSKDKDKVFGLYKRFHSHKEGRGLGLHLVKTQTELLGGKVEVDSKVNVGTTFSVYFREDTL